MEKVENIKDKKIPNGDTVLFIEQEVRTRSGKVGLSRAFDEVVQRFGLADRTFEASRGPDPKDMKAADRVRTTGPVLCVSIPKDDPRREEVFRALALKATETCVKSAKAGSPEARDEQYTGYTPGRLSI